MSPHRRSDADIEIGIGGRDRRYELGQIPFQMEPKGKEIGDNDDLAIAGCRQAGHGAGEIGLAEFQKGRLDVTERTQLGELGGDLAHAFVGAFDPGAVGKDNESRGHG